MRNLNMKLLFLWIAVYVIVLFLASVILAAFYKETIQKLIYKMSDDIHQYLSYLANRVAEKVEKKSKNNL